MLSVVAPQCAPRYTWGSATSSTSIRVTWTPPPNSKCRNGVLRGYKVAYKSTNAYHWIQKTEIDVKDTTTTVVTGLDKYIEYSFQVLAYTVKDGPLSNTLVRRTKEDGRFLYISMSLLHFKLNDIAETIQ